MKRPRFRLILVVVLALTATACGGAGDTDGGTGEDGQVALQFVLFGDATETAGYNRMLQEFESENPAIDVTLSPVASQDELLAKLTTSFAGGQPPDVFLINFRKYGQFASQGVLEEVDPYLEDSEVLDAEDFFPVVFDPFRFDGEMLTCMPQNVSSLVVYYNRDLFEAADLPLPTEGTEGWTWDEFLAAAQALTNGEVYGLGTEPSLIRIAPFVWSHGGEVVDDLEDPMTLMLDQGRARDALDWFLDLSLVHGVVPPGVEEQSESSASRFLNGRLGMYLNSRRVTPTMREIEGFTWDVAPLPVAPGGQPFTMLHSDAYCMAGPGEHHEESWRLIEFAMSERGQLILAESGRTVPSRRDVATSDVFLESDEPPASAHVFVDNAEILRATPHTANWTQVEKAADDILEQIYYGRTDRDEGMRRLIEETRRLFGSGG
ncbi:MAG: sugar ABC transporter substrate-binding protein [Actinobacteria bacterium]|nr:sugar ABC transporter substrate-binding protein [Actinomycetota bacterium]